MANWNGVIDGPPPSMVAKRFSEGLAKAIDAFNAHSGGAESAGIATALEGCDHHYVDEVVAKRGARIVELLDELDGEFNQLTDEVSFRNWRRTPTGVYHRQRLFVSRASRRPKPVFSVAELLDDLRGIAMSLNGVFGRPVERGAGLIKTNVPSSADYATTPAGYEGPDLSGRVGAA